MTDRATEYQKAAEYLRQHGRPMPENWGPARIIQEAERLQAEQIPGKSPADGSHSIFTTAR